MSPRVICPSTASTCQRSRQAPGARGGQGASSRVGALGGSRVSTSGALPSGPMICRRDRPWSIRLLKCSETRAGAESSAAPAGGEDSRTSACAAAGLGRSAAARARPSVVRNGGDQQLRMAAIKQPFGEEPWLRRHGIGLAPRSPSAFRCCGAAAMCSNTITVRKDATRLRGVGMPRRRGGNGGCGSSWRSRGASAPASCGRCEIVERAIETIRRAGLRAARDRAQPPMWSRSLQRQGARFVEGLDEIPAGAITIFSAHGVARGGGARGGRRACRCWTRPARWSPRCMPRAGATPPRAARWSWSAMPAIRRWRARSARSRGEVHLVASVAEVDGAADPAGPASSPMSPRPRSRWMTRAPMIEALRRRFHDIVGPDTRDICYATQNRQIGGAGAGAAGRPVAGCRRRQQFQFQPAARDRCGAGHALLPDPGCRGAAAGMAAGGRVGRHHRRGLRAGKPGAGA